MKILLLVLSWGWFAAADTLLVPEPGVEFASYQRHCRGADYICTNDYFIKGIAARRSNGFDFLMDRIDLNNPRSLDSFRNSIIHVLNSEELSLTQLRMLLTLLHEINRSQPTVLFRMIERELAVIDRFLQQPRTCDDDHFIFLFKEKIPVGDASRLQTKILKIPAYILHYSSLPQKTDTRKIGLVGTTQHSPLIRGECSAARLTQPIRGTKWVAFNKGPCSYSEQIGIITERTATSISKNKNFFWLAGLTSAAVLIANNYELAFNF